MSAHTSLHTNKSFCDRQGTVMHVPLLVLSLLQIHPIVEEASDTHLQGQPVESEVMRNDTFWILVQAGDQEPFLKELGLPLPG